MTPTDPTEEPSITDRGFMEFRPFNVWQDRATVQVCESSSAEGCKIWLSVTDLAGEATVQVDEDDALRLVRQVVYLLDHHHNADESEPAPPTSVEEPQRDALAALSDAYDDWLRCEQGSQAEHRSAAWLSGAIRAVLDARPPVAAVEHPQPDEDGGR